MDSGSDGLVCESTNAAGLFYVARRVPGQPPAVAVAPTPRQLVETTPGPWQLDRTWLSDWLRGEPDPAGTPYLGMRRLLAGQRLRVTPLGDVEVIDTTGPDVWPAPDLELPSAREQFLAAFDSAVRRLAADREVVACELSGGLDSGFLVATLGRVTTARIVAFTSVPDPRAAPPPGVTDASDAPWARAVVDSLPGRVDWDLVVDAESNAPLSAARRVAQRSWWPVYGVANIGWLEEVRLRAAARGCDAIWVGTHGNATFSVNYRTEVRADTPAPRRSARSVVGGLARRWGGRDGRADAPYQPVLDPRPAPAATRRRYLQWLAGLRAVHAGVFNPDGFPVPSVDPYRDPRVIATAARLTAQAWQADGASRGFARAVAAGRLPDAVRLRQQRGVQAPDVWFRMRHQRDAYEDEVARLGETTVIQDVVDVAAVRREVASWGWGGVTPPPWRGVTVTNRILALAQFIRDTEARLGAIGSG